MYYKEFSDMTKVHPEGVSENETYEISYVDAKEPDNLAKIMNPEYCGQLDQKICVLRDLKKREIVMSDSWMEQSTNIDTVREASGHVLIGGLGIGMILLAMQENLNIESITVVEISQELHDFIAPNLGLNDKVKIVISDIHDFIPDKKYDFVYCDIWNDISGDNFDEMCELTSKFRGSETKHWRYFSSEEMSIENDGYELEDFDLEEGHRFKDFAGREI